jgi:hypothetical protein
LYVPLPTPQTHWKLEFESTDARPKFKKFFVNVPGYMSWLFWIFKTILPAATFAKMSVVGSSPRSIGKALLPFIAPEELPKRYGGTASAEVFEKK